MSGKIKEEMLIESGIVTEEPILDEFGAVEEASNLFVQVKEKKDESNLYALNMEKPVDGNAPSLEEPSKSGKIKEEMLIENGIVKEEPILDEFGGVEEESILTVQVKEERDESNLYALNMEKPVDGNAPSLEEPSKSGKIKEEMLIENGIVKEEPILDEFGGVEEESILTVQVKEERDELSQSSEIWNEAKDHIKLESYLSISAAASSNDSILSEEEYFQSLKESRFPIVLLRPLNISDKIVTPQLHHSQLTTVKKCNNSVIISQVTRSVSEDNYVTDSNSLKQGTNSDIKHFRCSECDFECNKKGNLKQHMWTHSDIKRFRCSECGYGYNTKKSLKRHMLTHSDIKTFRFLECGYECKEKGNLKQHVWTHSDIKRFRCSECGYECNGKESLNRHMLTHSDIKQFRCSECGYECNENGNLKQHILTHSDIKLFRCSECDNEYYHKKSLKRHLMTNHGFLHNKKCLRD